MLQQSSSFEDILKRLQKKTQPLQNKYELEPAEACLFGINIQMEKIGLQEFEHKLPLSPCHSSNPKLFCTVCKGTGLKTFFHLETLREEILPNGCPCNLLEFSVHALQHSQIPPKYLLQAFECWDTQHLLELDPRILKLWKLNVLMSRNFVVAHARRIYTQYKNLGKEFLYAGFFGPESAKQSYLLDKVSGRPFLVLHGPVGVGKTMFATAILSWFAQMLPYEVPQRGIPQIKFVEFTQLLQMLREGYASRTSESDVMHPLRTAKVLLIDELGKGRMDLDWQKEKLDDLVTHRYNNKLITIFTTNFSIPHEENKTDFIPRMDTGRRDYGESSTNKNSVISHAKETLAERVGLRIFDRICELSLFLNFDSLPSYRRHVGKRELSEISNLI
jgi:DNA replication protein DnaC